MQQPFTCPETVKRKEDNMKKIISTMLSAAFIFQAFAGVVNAQQSVNIESVKTNGAGFVIDFDTPIAEESISDNIVVKDMLENVISEVSIDSDDESIVNVTIPKSMIGDTCTLIIKNGVSGFDGETLTDSYMTTMKMPGFYDEFGDDYKSGDWKWRNLSASGNAIVKDGMLWVIDSGSYNTTRNETIVHRKDYTDYQYATSVLEYDYLHTTKHTGGDEWKNGFSTLLKLKSDTISVVNWAWQLKNGYGFNTRFTTDTIRYSKYNGTNINSNTTDLKKQNLTAGNLYRYRIETTTLEDSVEIVIKRAEYTDGVLGDYTKVTSVTDNTNPDLGAGSVAFWSSKEGVLYKLDNVLYYGQEEVELQTLGEIKESIESEIEYYYDLIDDGNDYSAEIDEINIKINELLEYGMSIGEEYLEMLNELKKLKIISTTFEGGNVVIKFNKAIDEESVNDNIIVKNSEGVDVVTGLELSEDGKEIILTCSNDIYGKECFVTVNSDIENKIGTALGSDFMGIFTPEGFYEDFGDNYKNDWQYNCLGTINKANTKDGMLHLVNNSGTSNKNGEVVILYKNDYSDFAYKDSVLEFDYITIQELADAESWTNNWAAMVKVPKNFPYVSNWAFKIKAGYGFITKGNVDDLNFTRYSDTDPDSNRKTLVSKQNLPVGKPVRFRIETVTDEEKSKVTLKVYRAYYTDNVLGQFSLISTVTSPGSGATTDNTAFLGEGSCAFWAGRNGYHAVDNVKFVNLNQKINLMSPDEIADAVQASVDTLSEKNLTNDDKSEILKTGNMLEFLDNINYDIDESIINSYESLKEQYPLILTFNIEDKITHYESNIVFSTAIDKKYITKEYIKVTKNGESFDDYEIITADEASVSEVKLEIFNNRAYDGIFKVILNASMATPTGLNIGENIVCELAENANVVFSSLNASGNTLSGVIENKSAKSQDYTAVLTAWTDDNGTNKLLAVKAFKGSLNAAKTENVSVEVSADSEYKYAGYILNGSEVLSYQPVRDEDYATSEESVYEGINLDPGKETLKIGGKTAKKGRYAYAIVFNEGFDFDTITDENALIYAGAVTTNSQGYYLIETKLNSEFLLKDENGKPKAGYIYTYEYDDEKGLTSTPDKKFFASEEVRIAAVEDIKGATTAVGMDETSLSQMLEKYQNILGLTSDLFNGVTKEGIAKILYPEIPKLGITTMNAQEIVTRYALIAAFNEGKVDLVFKNGKFLYEDIMTLDDFDSREEVTLKNVFDSLLSESGKSAVVASMTNKSFTSIEDILDCFSEHTVLKTIYMSSKSGSGVVGEAITKNNADYISLDYGQYFSISENKRTKVNDKLLGNNYSDKAKLSTAIKSAIKALPSNDTGVGGSDNGGGSHSSSKAPAINSIPTGTGSVPAETPKYTGKFADMENALWADAAVTYLSDKGIVNGVSETEFAPNSYVTREQLCVMIAKAFELEAAENEAPFEDVLEKSYYKEAVASAYEAGIMIGINDKQFGVGQGVTRQDIATVIYRVIDEPELEGGKKAFYDEADIADYAKTAIEYLASTNVINGFDDNTFRPSEICTRAQAAKIIYEIIKNI